MRFSSGQSACRACGLPLDLTDDWVAIPPWEDPERKWAGFYHRECIALLPWWGEAVARWRATTEAQLRSRAASTQTVGRTDRYLLVYGAADRALELFYLRHLARQRFRGPDEWNEFVRFVAGVAAGDDTAEQAPGVFASPSQQFSARVVPPDRVVLGWGVAVRREMDFPRAEYDAYAAQHGPLQGYADFPRLVASGMLHPTMVDGELAKNRGVVVDVKPVKDVYVVSFDAARTVRLNLSREEFDDLAAFLTGIKLDS